LKAVNSVVVLKILRGVWIERADPVSIPTFNSSRIDP
jgi:hypothetical protein